MSFVCPTNMAPHCRKVLEGEYDVPGLELPPGSVVLDIGANCGAFTVWALKRWPDCRVIAYEPNPEAIEYWKRNCQGLNAELHPVAVSAQFEATTLFQGRNNLGEASLYRGEEQTDVGSLSVMCIHPDYLPDCAFLKLDCEGAERDIWRHYYSSRHPTSPKAVAFEFHSIDDRTMIDDSYETGLVLQRGHISRPDRGTLVYSR